MFNFWLGIYLGGYIAALMKFKDNDDLSIGAAALALLWPFELVVTILVR